MRRPLTEIGRLDRDLLSLDREIAECRRQLGRIRETEAVSASHSVRRAWLAAVIRRHLEWLEPMRDETLAKLRAEEAV